MNNTTIKFEVVASYRCFIFFNRMYMWLILYICSSENIIKTVTFRPISSSVPSHIVTEKEEKVIFKHIVTEKEEKNQNVIFRLVVILYFCNSYGCLHDKME